MFRLPAFLSVVVIFAVLALLPAPTTAQSPSERIAQASFTVLEREIIRNYYREQAEPDRQRGRGLPPGIEKNLARGKPLPPGIARQLPQALTVNLPPPPTGFERVYLDGRVLLVEISSQVVHDILSDLLL